MQMDVVIVVAPSRLLVETTDLETDDESRYG